MSIWLRMLVIWGITVSACVNPSARDDEPSLDAGSRRRSTDRTSSPPRLPLSDAGTAPADARGSRTLLDAGSSVDEPGRGRILTSGDDPDAEVDPDADAGLSELEEAILLDCTQTLSCNADPRSTVASCVSATTEALVGAAPESRQRFLAIIMRCRALRDCDYVSCVGAAP